MHRAIIGPIMAMARPSRPPAEGEAVRAAAIKLKCPSARAKAVHIAKQVAEAAIAYVDADPVEQRLADLASALEPCPIRTLGTYAADLVYSRRRQRFEAVGFRRVPDAEWAAETKAIQGEVERLLVDRYRRFLT